MPLDTTGTLLVLTPVAGTAGGDTPELTPYSARGLTQSLEPIPSGNLRRTINGELVDLTPTQFRKYQSTITCKDQVVPAFDDAWLGHLVTVQCVAELSYRTIGGSAGRTAVAGSARIVGDFTFYRPELTMLVVALRNSFDEWPCDYSWQLDLAEK